MQTFLSNLYSQKESDQKLSLFNKVNELIADNKFADIDLIFRKINITKLPTQTLVSLLLLTSPYEDKLDHRCMVYYKIDKMLGNNKHMLNGLLG